MKAFDDKNPWHSNADFLFGFQCNRCENEISLDDAKSEDFTEQCVEMSEIAQKSGWQCLDEFTFVCKSCAIKK